MALLTAVKHRSFAMFLAGQTVSILGDGVFTIAIAWEVLELSGSATALGLVLLVRSVTRVFVLLVAGALADRMQRRLLMLAGDLVQALAVAVVAVLAFRDALEVWHLMTVGAVTGAGSGIFLASSTALIPQLVPADALRSANSLVTTARSLGYDLLGPAMGGVLVATLGTATAFAVDAASFAAIVLVLSLIRPRSREERSPTSLRDDVREGFSYVRTRPWLWVTLIAVGTVGNFVAWGPLAVLVPVLIRDELGAGADTLGLVLATYGIGGVAAAVFAGTARLPDRSTGPAFLGWGLSALAVASLGVAPNAAIVALVLGVAGFFGETANVVWTTLLQKFVPDRLLGRVTSIDWVVSLSLQPLGVGLAGPAVAVIGASGAFVAGGLVTAAIIGLGYLRPGVRDLTPA